MQLGADVHLIPSTLLSPPVNELGIGGIGGFCVGYTIKKIAKTIITVLAIGFLGLQYLAFKGIVEINYLALQDLAMSLLGKAGALQGAITTLLAQMPFGVGFAVGLVLGLKKG
jgi:uncharacterized membrane protein (Fun14 family)